MNEYKMCALLDTVAGLFRPDDNKHQTKGLYQSRVKNDVIYYVFHYSIFLGVAI